MNYRNKKLFLDRYSASFNNGPRLPSSHSRELGRPPRTANTNRGRRCGTSCLPNIRPDTADGAGFQRVLRRITESVLDYKRNEQPLLPKLPDACAQTASTLCDPGRRSSKFPSPRLPVKAGIPASELVSRSQRDRSKEESMNELIARKSSFMYTHRVKPDRESMAGSVHNPIDAFQIYIQGSRAVPERITTAPHRDHLLLGGASPCRENDEIPVQHNIQIEQVSDIKKELAPENQGNSDATESPGGASQCRENDEIPVQENSQLEEVSDIEEELVLDCQGNLDASESSSNHSTCESIQGSTSSCSLAPTYVTAVSVRDKSSGQLLGPNINKSISSDENKIAS